MKKIPLRIGIRAAFFLSAFFLINSLHAQNYEIEKYFDYYGHELDRLITYSEQAESYVEYTGRLEIKFNVLKALWEKDRDRLKGKVNESEQSIEPPYEEWEREADARISRSKAAYIVKNAFLEEGGAEELKRNLSKKLQEITVDIASLDSTKGEQFEEYKRRVISAYKGEVSLIEGRIDRKYDILKQEFTDIYGSEGIQEAHLHTALEEEKHRVLYEKKVFLAALVSSSVNRIKYDLFADQRSLRLMMEKERAKKAADEIQLKVKEELERSVEERLDDVLRDEALSREDVMLLSKRVNKFYDQGYDQGLEIWAQAAADLVRKENEWYQNYNDVYNEGTSAWVTALNMLKTKKEEWADEFSRKVEEGLQDWTAVFEQMVGAKEELLSSLTQYRIDREEDFESYITHMIYTLEYGSDSVGQIDGYIDEFDLMIRETLRPFTKNEITREQIENYVDLFKQYIENDDRFWAHDSALSDIFKLDTCKMWYSKKKRRTDEITGGPTYYYISSENLDKGFKLNVAVECVVKRYWITFDGLLKGWNFNNNGGESEIRYYTIYYRYDGQNRWSRSVSSAGENGSGTLLDKPELSEIKTKVEDYLNIIDTLNEEKQAILESITDVQDAVIKKLADNEMLSNDPVLTDEDVFYRYYFGEEKEFLMNNFDSELYRAYYEKEFWNNQYNIIDSVLEYALDKAGREDAQDTINEYEAARAGYEDALRVYRELLEGNLNQAEGDISKLVAELDTEKTNLADAEKTLREALKKLSGLKVAEANLEMLIHSMYEQVSRAIQKKHAFLEGIWEFNGDKEEEAAQNLLKGTLELAQLQYEKIFEKYFDTENEASLVSIQKLHKDFIDIISEFSTTGVDGVRKDEIEEIILSLGEMYDEIAGSMLYGKIAGKIEHLKDTLDEFLAGAEKDHKLSRALALEKTYGDIYLIQKLFHSMIEAKKQAYAELYEHSADPQRHFDDEQERYFGEYTEDVKQYVQTKIDAISYMDGMLLELEGILNSKVEITEIHRYIADNLEHYIQEKKTVIYNFGGINFQDEQWLIQFEGIVKKNEAINQFLHYADMVLQGFDTKGEQIISAVLTSFIDDVKSILSDEKAYWEVVQVMLTGQGIMQSTLWDFLIDVRNQNQKDFPYIKELFTSRLHTISEYEKAYIFHASQELGLKLQFYSELGIQGGKNLDIEEDYSREFTDALGRINRIYQIDVLHEMYTRIETGYYTDRDKADINPVQGVLDAAVLRLFADMNAFEENGMLNARFGSLLKAMAGYCASAIYLKHESDFESVKGKEQALEELVFEELVFKKLINEKIVEYFDGLKSRAQILGFSGDELEKIAESMENYLVSVNSGLVDSIIEKITGISTEELGLVIQNVDKALDELDYYNPGDRFDIDGYFTAVLEETRFQELEELDSILSLELKTREEYEREKEYSEKIKNFSVLHSEKGLKAILTTGYISELYRHDPQKAFGKVFDIVCELAFQCVIENEIDDEVHFEDVYAYISGKLTNQVLPTIDINKGEKEAFINDVQCAIMSLVKAYEAELKRSGEYNEGVIFSSFCDEYVSVLDNLEKGIRDYKEANNIYMDFDSFIDYINGLDLDTNISNEEIIFIKQKYINEGRLQYAQKYFVHDKDKSFREEYLKDFSKTFQDFLLHSTLLHGTIPYSQAYSEYLVSDPLKYSFHELINNLYKRRNTLLDASGRSAFKKVMENKLTEFAKGEYEDYRGVIYDNRSILYSEIDISNPGEEVEPSEVSTAYNYISLDNPYIEQILSQIYFEGSGTYEYVYGDNDTCTIDTALTYISQNSAVNSYIEHQNRFVQVLLSLINLKNISEESAKTYLEDMITIETVDEKGNFQLINLNIFSDSHQDYAHTDTVIENGLETDLEGMIDVLTALHSEINISDRDGQLIKNELFTDGELLSMLASVKEIKDLGGNLTEEIEDAENNVDILEGSVTDLKGSVEGIEGRLADARKDYNNIRDQLGVQKKAVDEAYQEYLRAKEIYFYAQNIYLARDDTNMAVEMYKNRLLEYAAKRAEAEQRYNLLTDIKMKNGEINSEDGLAGLYDELNEKNASLNEAEEAFQILKIFHHLFTNKLNILNSRLSTLEESLEEKDINDAYSKELLRMKENLEVEITELEEINYQYKYVSFAPDSLAYSILLEGLEKIGTLDDAAIDNYITTLKDFIVNKEEEVFTNTLNQSLSMMVVELEDYINDQKGKRQSFIEKAGKTYNERYDVFTGQMLLKYTNYVSGIEEYETEAVVSVRQIGYLMAELNKEEMAEYKGYVALYKGRWDELDLEVIDMRYQKMLLLESRKEQLEELLVVYEYLSGQFDVSGMTEEEKERWGEGLATLKEKYGIGDEDVLNYEDIVNGGILFDICDFSDTGVLKTELGRKKELLDKAALLDYYNTITENNLFYEMLKDMKQAYMMIGEAKEALEEYRFELQIGAVVEEKNRFHDKVMMGKENGLEEWDNQFIRIRGEYRKWVSEMKERFDEALEEWSKKEVEYVRKRDEWVKEVGENSLLGDNEGFSALEDKIQDLTDDISISVRDMSRNAEALEQEYSVEMPIPQWISDYQVLANTTFGRLKKAGLSDEAVEESIRYVRENMEAFEAKKESLEAEKLYFKLKKAQETILAEIRNVDEMNRMMVDEVMEEAKFIKKGSGYERRMLVDYSLLGGRKEETKKIGLFSVYRVDEKQFSLAGIEDLKSSGDSTDLQIFIMKETERLRRAKEEALGTKEYAGDIYKKHIGRFPTGEDVGKYIGEKQEKKGILGNVKKLFGKVMKKIVSLFVKKEKNKEGDYSDFQKMLVKEIQYPVNRGLETGRIMLEYQRLELIEAEAKEKADSGFFNAPLFPGWPSLKSIGNVALSIATGGASAVVQSVVQIGWNVVTTVTTAAEGKMDRDEAVLNIMKDIAVTAVTGGFSESGSGIADASLKDMGSLSNNIKGAAKQAAYEAKRHMINQAAASAVNAIELDDHGRLGWNSASFGTGIGTGVLTSVGRFGGSFAANTYDVRHGATWSGSGYNYNYMEDIKGGGYIADYFNTNMKRMGGMLGGLTEQGINNMTGMSDGLTLNVLNSRDFGLKNEVGMVTVTLGGSKGFDWDVSRGGLNVSASGIKGMYEGMERVKLYNEVLNGGNKGLQVAYMADNKTRYSYDTLSEEEISEYKDEYDRLINELEDYLQGNSEIGFNFNTDKNMRLGDTIFINNTLVNDKDFKVEDGLIHMDLNKAAKLASLISHELMHDGDAGTFEEAEAVKFQNVVVKGLIRKFGYDFVLSDARLLTDYLANERYEKIRKEQGKETAEEFLASYVDATHDTANDSWKFEGEIFEDLVLIAEEGDTLNTLEKDLKKYMKHKGINNRQVQEFLQDVVKSELAMWIAKGDTENIEYEEGHKIEVNYIYWYKIKLLDDAGIKHEMDKYSTKENDFMKIHSEDKELENPSDEEITKEILEKHSTSQNLSKQKKKLKRLIMKNLTYEELYDVLGYYNNLSTTSIRNPNSYGDGIRKNYIKIKRYNMVINGLPTDKGDNALIKTLYFGEAYEGSLVLTVWRDPQFKKIRSHHVYKFEEGNNEDDHYSMVYDKYKYILEPVDQYEAEYLLRNDYDLMVDAIVDLYSNRGLKKLLR